MIKQAAAASLWLVALAAILLGANDNEPYLVPLRGAGNAVLLAAGIIVPIILLGLRVWRGAPVAGRLLLALWCLPAPSLAGAQLVFALHRMHVLDADASAARRLGRHFVVGYASADEAGTLAAKGLIAGVYVTGHNVAGRRAGDVKAEIASLQDQRRAAGLPPLMVAADQEGGIVSHLAPPLTAWPGLATFADLPPDARRQKAEELGRRQGKELADIGVNLDLAPVLDLRPPPGPRRFDFNTLIGQRAISDDPTAVAEIALAYVRGLEASGVGATAKHFPGLSRVDADTHHFSAKLTASEAELEASDWLPFKTVLAGSKARLMVGHATLEAIDPDHAASHSKRVIDGIIRRKWNYQGVVMTDDLVMGAIYGGNLCAAVVEALNAGADLLLVAYDGAQFYRVFDCALDALNRGELDPAMLAESEARLTRAEAEAASTPGM